MIVHAPKDALLTHRVVVLNKGDVNACQISKTLGIIGFEEKAPLITKDCWFDNQYVLDFGLDNIHMAMP